jgi:hypothetical protein
MMPAPLRFVLDQVDCVSVHGMSIEQVFDLYKEENRDTQIVELWAGRGTVTSAAVAEGMSTLAFDIIYDKSMDFCTVEGFLKASRSVMRLVQHGLLWMSPECSSWLYFNAQNTRRSRLNWEGDTSYQPVVDGNTMAKCAAFFLVLSLVRNLEACVESSAKAWIFNYPPLKSVITMMKMVPCVLYRCVFDFQTPYGKRYQKGYKVFCTGSWLQRLEIPCQCPKKKHVSMVHVEKSGKTSGDKKALGESAHYPQPLGNMIIQAYLHRSNTSWSPGDVIENISRRVAFKRPAPTTLSQKPSVAKKTPAPKTPTTSSPTAPPPRGSSSSSAMSGEASWLQPLE